MLLQLFDAERLVLEPSPEGHYAARAAGSRARPDPKNDATPNLEGRFRAMCYSTQLRG